MYVNEGPSKDNLVSLNQLYNPFKEIFWWNVRHAAHSHRKAFVKFYFCRKQAKAVCRSADIILKRVYDVSPVICRSWACDICSASIGGFQCNVTMLFYNRVIDLGSGTEIDVTYLLVSPDTTLGVSADVGMYTWTWTLWQTMLRLLTCVLIEVTVCSRVLWLTLYERYTLLRSWVSHGCGRRCRKRWSRLEPNRPPCAGRWRPGPKTWACRPTSTKWSCMYTHIETHTDTKQGRNI